MGSDQIATFVVCCPKGATEMHFLCIGNSFTDKLHLPVRQLQPLWLAKLSKERHNIEETREDPLIALSCCYLAD